ncbi:hypothetical protein J2W97_001360 [Paenibacillus jamilae]|nr:hypothetical protein [Paenibacillus jamilae]
MKEKYSFKFTGYPSGDHEAYCFDVCKSDYRHTTSNEPDKVFDKSCFHKGYYRLYPDDLLLGIAEQHKKYKFEIIIKVKEERVDNQ